jgi:hypothetical protein
MIPYSVMMPANACGLDTANRRLSLHLIGIRFGKRIDSVNRRPETGPQ